MNSISLHTLPKVTTRSKKRVGRGYGSGKGGHTSGRGQKGQKSRRTIPWSFEGGALPLSQRLPFWRGKGRLNPLKPKPIPVNIRGLERFPDGTVVDLSFLVKERIIHQSEADARGVKILGDGKLTKKLTVVGMRTSGSAKEAVEKAGGSVGDRDVRVEIEKEKTEEKEQVVVSQEKTRKTQPRKLKTDTLKQRVPTKKEVSRKKTPAGKTKKAVVKKKRLAQKTKKQ